MNYYVTVNYLFAAYLQTKEGGSNKIVKSEKIRRGRAKFYFNMTEEEASKIKLKFIDSCCSEFERFRQSTIDLAY